MARIASTVACILWIGLAGCLETKDVAKLSADGSGTFVQTYEVDLNASKQLLDMFEMFRQGMPGAPAPSEPKPAVSDLMPDVFSAEATAALAKGVEGFTLESHDSRESQGRRTVTVTAKFQRLEGVAKAGRFFPAAVELAKNEDGSYTLAFEYRGVAAYMDAVKAVAGGKASLPFLPEGTDPSALVPLLEPILGTLSVERTITLPGTIVETNGTKGEDGSITWTARYAELMGTGFVQKATFRAEGLDLAPFRSQPDFADLYRRVVEANKAAAEKAKAGGGTPPPAPPVTPPPETPPAPGMGG
jgi:hypothetical protein